MTTMKRPDEAFIELHERYERRIYFFALKRMSDSSDAEDVTQEVFLQVTRIAHEAE